MTSKVKFDIPNYSLMLLDANEKTVQEAGSKIEQYAKESAPVDSGYYRNNIMFDGKNEVVAHADYSAHLEYGTKPHVIKPQSAKYLHFKGKDGKEVFAKVVNHPGTRPQPIMRNAALKVQKDIGGIFTKHYMKRSG